MRFVKFLVTTALALFFAGSLAQAKETLTGAGASFPYPVYSAWAYDYHRATGIQLNYQSIGSGGGVRQITARTVDFGASDAPLTAKELEKDKLLQFPAVMGGVVPVVNISGVKAGTLKLTGAVLAQIYIGEITRWDDQAIKSMNSKVKLPHAEISVVHRSDGSGTTAIFSTYLSGVSSGWKAKVGAGKSLDWPVGIGGKGNEGVANYTRKTPNAIGYVEYAYAMQNKLAYVVLQNAAGNFVEPGFETFSDAAASADFNADNHFDLWLVNAPGKNAWPIAGATFILLAKEKKDADKKVTAFYHWAFQNGDAKAMELVYVPLPEPLKAKIRAYWKANGVQ